MKKCTICKYVKKDTDFYRDSSRGDGLACRCKSCDKDLSQKRNSMTPKVGKRGRKRVPIRSGDRTQARTRIRVMVAAGEIPNPNTLPCFDCRRNPTEDRKHEYDHYAGYELDGHDKVQPVCRVCHRRRERERAGKK